MVVASEILWWGHRVPILRSHVEQGEPLEASAVELPGRSRDGFSGDRTCFYVHLKIGLRVRITIEALQVLEVNKWREDLLHVFFG